MYTIASNEITSRIESYKALWGMLIEDVQSGAPVAYDGIQNVQTDIQSTTLSDDIELGAVCSQSVTADWLTTELSILVTSMFSVCI